MILSELCHYYDILNNDKDVEIPLYGYSNADVSFSLVINTNAELTDIIDLRSEDKKPKPRTIKVPQQISRSSDIVPYFLCDNAKYIFGVEKIKKKDRQKTLEKVNNLIEILSDDGNDLIVISKRSQKCFTAFKELHHKKMDVIIDDKIKQFLNFLDTWNPKKFLTTPVLSQYIDDLLSGANCVFEFSGMKEFFLHDIPCIKDICVKSTDSPDEKHYAQCLITGKNEEIARVHKKIKGVNGAQVAGASIVSFNNPAFCSYDKKQSYNAPISIIAEFKYVTALNYLLGSSNHKILIGDSTTVFWAETESKELDELVNTFLGKQPENTKNDQDKENIKIIDHKQIHRIENILTKLKSGKKLNIEQLGTDPDTNFYLLCLSPNNARISIRYWYIDHFGNFIERLAQHHVDMEIIKEEWDYPFVSFNRILNETIAKKVKNSKTSPIISGLLMDAVLHNSIYPIQLYYAILSRVKVENEINYVKAGFIKAYLLRQSRNGHFPVSEEMITMKLDENNTNVPYRLGRLFAVLENVQRDTNKSLGSTITSKYFSSASSTPAIVFPVLLKLAQHHISKSKWGELVNKRIEEILSEVDSFPAYLTLEEQGMFMLGYYHQKKDFFVKKELPEQDELNMEEEE